MASLKFLCPAPLQNVFYQSMKFQVDSFYSLKVMAWTKFWVDQKTDPWTDKATSFGGDKIDKLFHMRRYLIKLTQLGLSLTKTRKCRGIILFFPSYQTFKCRP